MINLDDVEDGLRELERGGAHLGLAAIRKFRLCLSQPQGGEFLHTRGHACKLPSELRGLETIQ
jgi:hypothetical protein